MNGPRDIADSAALRASNVSRALSEIRRRGDAARVDLVESLDLSPATVSAVVSELLESGLVIEAPAASGAGRGRPRIQLRLNPKARMVAGAKLSANKVTVAILDFCGEIISTASTPTGPDPLSADAFLKKIEAALRQALLEADLKESCLLYTSPSPRD